MTVTSFMSASTLARRNRIVHYLIAFPFAVRNVMRRESNMEEMRDLWDDVKFHDLLAMGNVPNALLMACGTELAQAVQEKELTEYTQGRIDSMLSLLMKLRAGAEKLSHTPVPFVFAIEGSRIVILFMLTLPFVIVPTYEWMTPAVSFLLSYELLSIEAMGTEIEDPFGNDFNDLPLDDMCETHHEDMLEYLTYHNAQLRLQGVRAAEKKQRRATMVPRRSVDDDSGVAANKYSVTDADLVIRAPPHLNLGVPESPERDSIDDDVSRLMDEMSA